MKNGLNSPSAVYSMPLEVGPAPAVEHGQPLQDRVPDGGGMLNEIFVGI